MNKKKILERIENGLQELYGKADSAFPTKFTWLEALRIMEMVPNCKRKQFPYFAFYVPEKEQAAVVRKARRYTRHSWRWPRRTEMDGNGHIIHDPEWDEHIAAREEMAKKLDAKEITRAEFSRWMDDQAEKYGMIRRNYDGEQIGFNILNYAPTTDEKGFSELKRLFIGAYEMFLAEENRGKEEIKFVTLEDFPEVTDADVDAKIAENKELLGLNEGTDNKSDYASAITNPDYVRKWLEESRVRHADYLNKVLYEMCEFWAAYQCSLTKM